VGELRSELVVVRHGQAHCNVERIVAGPACRGLTPSGRRAAEAVAVRLAAGDRVDTLLASPTARAVETARVIGTHLDVPVRTEAALRVPDPGAGEGLTWSQWREAVAAGSLPDGAEPWPTYLDRASQRLEPLLNHPDGRRTVVVGHSETVAAVLHCLIGADLGRLRLDVDYASVSTFRSVPGDGRDWSLVEFNDTAHIPGGLERFPGHAR
jgi:probable phosphoglycerate mutase